MVVNKITFHRVSKHSVLCYWVEDSEDYYSRN